VERLNQENAVNALVNAEPVYENVENVELANSENAVNALVDAEPAYENVENVEPVDTENAVNALVNAGVVYVNVENGEIPFVNVNGPVVANYIEPIMAVPAPTLPLGFQTHLDPGTFSGALIQKPPKLILTGHIDNLEYRLRQRQQGQTELPQNYVYDVLNLCFKVNNNMSEQVKIKHLIRDYSPN